MKRTAVNRIQRIADQIQRDLAEMIQRELRNPQLGLVTLTDVQLTPDYAHAKVYFSVIGAEPQTAQQILSEKAGYLHSLLYKRLQIHTVPTLHFVFDPTTEKAAEIDGLIRQALSHQAKDD
ncbi:30S ribosome-binding factor RbfA [Thiomonas sp.]|uniref:30S ribosome-binding factor RbfA n=1 Tax=Thiomonas sp. TaxID=2047785 RepID=UPI002619EC3B|nr:30S ribosome-binding factor RbfA [Thiomonas sp.]